MVRLHEYQGKRLLRDAGVSVPAGDAASTPEDAARIAERLGKPVAVKAQVWATGRFKAGGIRFADNPQDVLRISREILGSRIRGATVERVLVEEKLAIAKEFYLGVIVDDSYRVKAPVIMFSTEGGVDIEQVASASPEKISSLAADVLVGLSEEDSYKLVSRLAIPQDLQSRLASVARDIYSVFGRHEARSLEVNPLALTKTGEILAADCRVTIDDWAVARHPELGIEVPRESPNPPTPLERAAWKIEVGDYRGVAYFMQIAEPKEGEGYVGYHGIGGGGALLGADALLRHGLKIANYADTSGNPTASKVYRIAKIIISQPGIEAYFLCGAVIASQDQWHHAHGLVKAFREELTDRPGFPVVLLIAGNRENEAIEILKEGLADLPINVEIYGRDYVYKLDFLAERLRAMIEEYRKTGGRSGS